MNEFIVTIALPIEIQLEAEDEQQAIINANKVLERILGLRIQNGYTHIRASKPSEKYKVEKVELPF